MPDEAIDTAPAGGGGWLGWTALGLSMVGFAMSRGYDAVVARAGFVVLDYYLGVTMVAVHVGFVLAAGLLVAGARRPGLPLTAIALAVLTFVWVP